MGRGSWQQTPFSESTSPEAGGPRCGNTEIKFTAGIWEWIGVFDRRGRSRRSQVARREDEPLRGGKSHCKIKSIKNPHSMEIRSKLRSCVRSKHCLPSPLFEVTSAQTTLRMGSPGASGSYSKDRGLRSGVSLPSLVSLWLWAPQATRGHLDRPERSPAHTDPPTRWLLETLGRRGWTFRGTGRPVQAGEGYLLEAYLVET